MTPKRLAIFASGSGTNAEAIMKHFESDENVQVTLVLSNKPDAFVLKRAEKFNVPSQVFTRDDFYQSCKVLDLLKSEQVDYIVLAGFLWLVPKELIAAYRDRIVNIHPSLLPKHGGKGMYGAKVHQAVVEQGDAESGITIHLVDEIYDNGRILSQHKVSVDAGETADSLAAKIHELEYAFFPKTIEQFVAE